MEHMDLISHTNLELLKSIIQEVCPMLTGKIDQFKAQHSKLQKILIANGTHKNEKCINEDTTKHRDSPEVQIRTLIRILIFVD